MSSIIRHTGTKIPCGTQTFLLVCAASVSKPGTDLNGNVRSRRVVTIRTASDGQCLTVRLRRRDLERLRAELDAAEAVAWPHFAQDASDDDDDGVEVIVAPVPRKRVSNAPTRTKSQHRDDRPRAPGTPRGKVAP